MTNHIGVPRRSSSFIGHTDTQTATPPKKNAAVLVSPPPPTLFFKSVVAPFVWPSFPFAELPKLACFPASLVPITRKQQEKEERSSVKKSPRFYHAAATAPRKRVAAANKAEAWTCTAASAVTLCAFWDGEGTCELRR